jgi:FtsP/CotA-like multicopper oxidase with cupredoxin domain
VGDGLYGALLVEPSTTPAEPAMAPAEIPADLQDQLVMVLSDISLNPDGTLADPNSDSGGDFGTLFGRTGEVLLVNGKIKPTIKAVPGLRQRWRIINSAKTRYFQLALAGHKFTQLGVDGGYLEAPRETDTVLVIPGGRADVIVTPTGAPGTELTVRWVPYDRGYGTTFMIPDEALFKVALVDGVVPAQAPLPARLRTIAPIDTSTATAREVALTQDLSTGKLVLGINGVPAWDAKALEAHAGDTEVWTISNEMDFDHPFHLHGFFFQPLDATTGAPLASREWLDTYNVPKHDKVQIAVKYDDRAGMWMFHCHILDHADAGMMGMLMLKP